MSRVFKTPEAERDLWEQAEHIMQSSLDVAQRFLHAAEATFEALARMPQLGERCRFRSPRAAGTRVWQVRGFPNHLVFYRQRERAIEIVRVLHGARDLESAFGDPREDA